MYFYNEAIEKKLEVLNLISECTSAAEAQRSCPDIQQLLEAQNTLERPPIQVVALVSQSASTCGAAAQQRQQQSSGRTAT